MSGLAKYFEEEGLATTLIALVRRQAEEVAPPRALWVSFPLGRPFGEAGDPAFQTRVIRAALALFDRDEGPILEDYPEAMPAPAEEANAWVCPVRFPKPATADRDRPLAPLMAELEGLKPWYALSRERRGRSTVGASGLTPEEALRFLEAWRRGERPESPRSEVTAGDMLRLASEDLKAYYGEAATAQPGRVAGDVLSDWFWHETVLADLLQDLRRVCLAEGEGPIFDVGDFMLVPEAYQR